MLIDRNKAIVELGWLKCVIAIAFSAIYLSTWIWLVDGIGLTPFTLITSVYVIFGSLSIFAFATAIAGGISYLFLKGVQKLEITMLHLSDQCGFSDR